MNKKNQAGFNGAYSPLLFHFETIATLFFNKKKVKKLIKNRIINIDNVSTITGEKADILIRLTDYSFETFQLTFIINSRTLTENFSIFDEIILINQIYLKHLLYRWLCDHGEKHNLIECYNENYNLQPKLHLN